VSTPSIDTTGDLAMHQLRARSSQRGFSLAEILVASAIFLFIAMAAFAVFNSSNKLYQRNDAQAEMQQRTRLAFDVLMDEVRLAGFDYNRDGDQNTYPDQSDEQIEYAGAHAITLRGNLDYDDEVSGREATYEADSADPLFGTLCCPIVTTANDEIVTYALRSDTSSANTGSIVLHADLTMPRDGGYDVDGLLAEESATIDNVDLVGNTPPYTLMRFSFNDDGRIVEQPVANNIRSLTFTYQGTDGLETFCTAPAADGTCPMGSSYRFDEIGGDDDIAMGDLERRTVRAGIRRLGIEFVGMTERNVRNFVDRNDSRMPSRPKLTLTGTVVPMNLGMKGQPDLEEFDDETPDHVTACGGQCNSIRVDWDEVDNASGYWVKLFLSGQIEPFFTGATPGIAIDDTNPPRAFAVFNASDHASIVTGALIYAKVQARFAGDETSDESDPSTIVTLSDAVRPSGPTAVQATGYDASAAGWPAVVDNLVPPMTDSANRYHALGNSIVVSWVAPHWALQAIVGTPGVGSSTTAPDVGSAPVACDSEDADLDADTVADGLHTRLREVTGTTRYLIFRSTNPRFVPTDADFVAATPGVVDDEAGRVSFEDRTHHEFINAIFKQTTNALQNCTTYYYRVRAVDACWSGSNPSSVTDAHVSPFFPPLNPNPNAQNSDDTVGVSPADVPVAIPGYAVPKSTLKAPAVARFRTYDRRLDDGDGRDATIAFDAVKLDDTTAVDAGGNVIPAYEDVTLVEYRVYSHATNQNFTVSDMKNLANGVRLDKTIRLWDLVAGRIAYDDENNNGTIIDAEDEAIHPISSVNLPNSGLRIDLEPTTSRYYRVVAVQCANEDTIPSVSDPTGYDFSAASTAIKFPCDFGGGPYTTISLSAGSFPNSVSSDAVMEDFTVSATRARLVLKNPTTGERAMTAGLGKVPTSIAAGAYRATFNATDISSITNDFGAGSYVVSVEWDDSNSCMGVSDSGNQAVSPPGCCLAPTTPVITRVTNTQGRTGLTIACGAASASFQSLTLTVNNANGGPAEKFDTVTWTSAGVNRTWTTSNNATITVDLTANPIVLGPAATATIDSFFTRNAAGDTVTVTYTYKIGGATGSCTFSGVM